MAAGPLIHHGNGIHHARRATAGRSRRRDVVGIVLAIEWCLSKPAPRAGRDGRMPITTTSLPIEEGARSERLVGGPKVVVLCLVAVAPAVVALASDGWT